MTPRLSYSLFAGLVVTPMILLLDVVPDERSETFAMSVDLRPMVIFPPAPLFMVLTVGATAVSIG